MELTHISNVVLLPTAEIQAFDGLAPEVINSRLAMLGFAVAAFFELTQGLDVFQQVKAYPLLTIATFVIFTTASWIPFLQGQSYNVKSGPFTPAVRVHPSTLLLFIEKKQQYIVSLSKALKSEQCGIRREDEEYMHIQ